MKFPPSTLKLISQYLPNHPEARASLQSDEIREYTIDELARASSLTARNIRAYQDKGLIPPPKLRGRKGIYSEKHLGRLRVITSLLDRGYTVSSVRELLDALEQGMGLGELMGIETAITSPWSDENPQTVSIAELQKLFGNNLTPEVIEKCIKLELISMEGSEEGTEVRVSSMNTLKAGAELAETGIPLEDLLDIVRMMRGNVERVANELVKLVSEHVLASYDQDALPPNEDLPQLAELIWRLRPLAETAVKAELARAMEKAATQFLADKLEQIMSNLD